MHSPWTFLPIWETFLLYFIIHCPFPLLCWILLLSSLFPFSFTLSNFLPLSHPRNSHSSECYFFLSLSVTIYQLFFSILVFSPMLRINHFATGEALSAVEGKGNYTYGLKTGGKLFVASLFHPSRVWRTRDQVEDNYVPPQITPKLDPLFEGPNNGLL